LCREGSGFSCRGCRVQEHSMYACISLSLSLFLVLPPLSFPLGHSSFESYKHQETVKNITMYFRSKISKSVGTSSTSLQGFLNVEKNCWGRRDESVESSVSGSKLLSRSACCRSYNLVENESLLAVWFSCIRSSIFFFTTDLQFKLVTAACSVQTLNCQFQECVAVLVNLLLLNSKMLSKETDILVQLEDGAHALPSYLIRSFCELMFFSHVFICFLDSSSLAVIILMHNWNLIFLV
jgi:hypothetical protein